MAKGRVLKTYYTKGWLREYGQVEKEIIYWKERVLEMAAALNDIALHIKNMEPMK